MEAANGAHITSSNKVIVQCSDPSNIYDKVQPLLEARLPLRTLHWKSATRPLRSIDELDVTLLREDGASSETPGHARRHQIPGLRQTPYVKLLLLRCDDKDTYKESVRKDAKAWVKSLDVSTSGKPTVKGQERHDAYEYIIVHVVFPDTPAALQPKSSKHISVADTDSTDSVNSTNKSKWTGKSASTIYDKLRADFHSSSKAPFERVAQIRITDPQKPSSALGPLDIEEQWNDLVDKLKTAILQSFDARVAQYEEDIREREMQRTLPGWNFCTFFILKEGLARGFENVGLLEDALSVYEELDAGLDGIIQEQAKDGESDAMNALLPYASNLKSTIRSVLENKANGHPPPNTNDSVHMLDTWIDLDKNNLPLALERRNYQQMILTNQVCALDFRIYIFIRQFQILLRRAVIPESTKSGKRKHEIRYDAAVLAIICERSLKFINFAARNLRQDLIAAWGGSDALPEHEQHDQHLIINNIVASWKWSACIQILHECQVVKTISDTFARLDESTLTYEELLSSQVLNKSADLARDRAMSVTSTSTDASVSHDANRSAGLPITTAKNIRGQRESWIFWSAEIFDAMRTILAQLELARGTMQTIENNNDVTPPSPDSYDELLAAGLLAPSLRHVTYLHKNIRRAFRLLTVSACQCYIVVGRKRMAKALLLELAREDARYQRYASAAGWLCAIEGLLDREPCDKLDEASLDLYAECLTHLDRPIERARCLLSCMRSVARDRSATDIQDLFQNVLQAAANLDKLEETFDGIFELAQIDTFVKHIGSPPRLTLKVVLRLLLPIKVPEMQVWFSVKAKDSSDPSTISFTYSGAPYSESSKIELDVQSDVSTFGWYEMDYLELKIGKLCFYHNLKQQHLIEDDEGFKTPGSQDFMSRDIYMYPPLTAPSIDARHAEVIDLSNRRSVSITLNWRSTDLEKAVLRLKPSTAGFRLDLQSAKHKESTDSAAFAVRRINDILVLEFDRFSGTPTTLDIPFTLDSSTPVTSASISSQLTYTIAGSTLQTHQTLSVSTLLPISVNVQDVFQAHATFCRFTIAPSTNEPVSLIECKLDENPSYEVTAPTGFDTIGTLAVFSRQPAGWIARITPKVNDQVAPSHGTEEKLQLSVRYACMSEIVIEAVLQKFEADLGSSDVAYASEPLRSHVVERLRTLWSELDMELIALTGEIHLWSFEDFDWSAILFAFDKTTRSRVVAWLRKWHDRRATMNIQVGNTRVRTLKLMVDVPKAEIIVTTQMKLPTGPTVALGKPLSARVSLCCTGSAPSNPDTEVSFEVLAPSDSWLIGGKRKGGFLADQKQYEVVLVLVPQKAGQLLLPTIDVKCVNASNAPNATKAINLDTEHLSAATSVFVVPSLELTSIGITNAEFEVDAAGQGQSGGDHWLLGSKRRSEAL